MTDMLGDPQFYVECPIFLFMRDMGLESYAQYMKNLSGPECKDCSDRSVMGAALITFMRHIKQQADVSLKNLVCIKDYLQKRKGYYPEPCVLYYKESQKPLVPLEF